MPLTRSEAMLRIEGQRRAIREHIEKFNRYEYRQDKDFALKTISRCQREIEDLKRKCNVYIESSWEDSWSAPYYALSKEALLALREELMQIKEQEINESEATIDVPAKTM